MSTPTTYSLKTVLGQLDRCSEKRTLKLKGIKIAIRISGHRNPSFNRLYDMYKSGVPLKCSCCGAEPKHVTYHPKRGLRMIVGDHHNYLNIEHIIPRSKGGTWDQDNLAIMCFKCNVSKGNKLDEETEAVIAAKQKQYNLIEVYKSLKRTFRQYREEIKRMVERLIDILGSRVVSEEVFMKKVVKHFKALIQDFEPERIRFETV